MKHCSRPRRLFFIPLIIVAVVSLISLVVMLLWNGILPVVFGIKAITYWQAMGILVLCKILFGVKGGRPGWGRHHFWEKRMREKFASMSPEEREKFKDEFKRRASEWHMPPGPGAEEV